MYQPIRTIASKRIRTKTRLENIISIMQIVYVPLENSPYVIAILSK